MACLVQQQPDLCFHAAVEQRYVAAVDLRGIHPDVLSSLWASAAKQLGNVQGTSDVKQQRDQAAPSSAHDPFFPLFTEAEREFLRECLFKQAKTRADATYLATVQPEIDAHKRLMLVDWLVEVVDEFRLSQESLYLAVCCLDRFLSLEPVRCCHLQLLGVTCLWVASKFEEVMPPCLQEFVTITDNSYHAQDLVRMEGILLTTLGFELAVPTPLHFLHQLLAHVALEAGAASPPDSPTYSSCSSGSGGGSPCKPTCPDQARLAHLAEYLLELALLTPDTLRYAPSVVAASALQLAASLLCGHSDPATAAAARALCGGIGAAVGEALEGCMAELARMQRWAAAAPQPPAVQEKYSDVRYSCVGRMQLLSQP